MYGIPIIFPLLNPLTRIIQQTKFQQKPRIVTIRNAFSGTSAFLSLILFLP